MRMPRRYRRRSRRRRGRLIRQPRQKTKVNSFPKYKINSDFGRWFRTKEMLDNHYEWDRERQIAKFQPYFPWAKSWGDQEFKSHPMYKLGKFLLGQ